MFLSLLLTLGQAQKGRVPLVVATSFLQAYSGYAADAFSFPANQAALAKLTSFSAGLYSERRFGLSELTFYQGALAVPVAYGAFGFSGRYFGNTLYNEASAGLAYGRQLGKKVDIGAQFNYQSVAVARYGRAAAVYVELGALWHLGKQVHVGVHSSNPTLASLNMDKEEPLPTIHTLGIGYDVSDQVFLAGEVQKSHAESLAVNAAVQYRFHQRLWSRVGFRSATSAYYISVGAGLKYMKVDVVASVHPQLGITPGLQLIFIGKEKRQEQ